MAGRKEILFRSESFGKAFEHFIIQEIRAYLDYHQVDEKLSYWRTVSGTFEVDCIIGDEIAIEIKAAESFQDKMISGLVELKKEKKIKNFFLISRDPTSRVNDGIQVIPYQQFLERLWSDKLLSS